MSALDDYTGRAPACCGQPMTVARDHGDTALLRCLVCGAERPSRDDELESASGRLVTDGAGSAYYCDECGDRLATDHDYGWLCLSCGEPRDGPSRDDDLRPDGGERVDEEALERERYGKLLADIGEDPARYLDHPMIRAGDMPNMGELLEARTRGLRDPATLAAFRAVERNLDRGPREWVLEQLDHAERSIATRNVREAHAYLARPFGSPHVDRLLLAREWRERLRPADERASSDHPSARERFERLVAGRDLTGTLGGYDGPQTDGDTTEDSGLEEFVATDGGGPNAE